MPDQINQIPINFGLDPQDAQILSQIAKDIDKIVKALNALGKKNLVNKEDANEAQKLEKRLEELKKKQQEALGIVHKLTLAQKQWKAEILNARTPEELARAQAELKKVNTELQKAAGTTNTWGKALGSFQFKFNALGNMAAMLSGQLWMGATRLVQGLANGFPVIKEFEKSFAAVDSILSRSESREFGGMLRQASIDTMRQYGLAIQDVNLALYDAISSNVQAGEAAEFLDAAAKLAVGGLTTLNDTVKGLASINNAFGLSMKNSTDVAAGFFTAQKYGITYVDEMVESFGRMNAVAKLSGASWQEMMAAFSAITLAGLNTEETVTALRNVFNELLKPSRESSKAISALKSTFEDIEVPMGAVELRTKGFTETMRELKKVYESYPEEMSKIFGNIRGFSGVTSLLGGQFDKFLSILGELEDTATNLDNLFKALRDQLDTTTKQVELRKGAWEAFWVSMDEGDGVLSRVSKGWNKFWADFATGLQVVNGSMELWEQAAARVKANTPEFEHEGIVNAQRFYDDLKKKIDAGTVSIEQAYDILRKQMADLNEDVIYRQKELEEEVGQVDLTPGATKKAAQEYVGAKAYFDRLIVLYGEMYKAMGWDGNPPQDDEAKAVDYLTMNYEALSKELERLVSLKKSYLAADMKEGSDEIKNLNGQIKMVKELMDLYGDEEKAKKKIVDLDKQAIDAIRLRYMLERMRVDVTRWGINKELELLYIATKEKDELAQFEIDNEEQRAEYRRLIWKKFYQDVEELEKKHSSDTKKWVYDDFLEDKKLAEMTNDAFLQETENRMRKELQMSGATGDKLKAGEENIAREIAQMRMSFTLKWAEFEYDIVKRLYGENSQQALMLAAAIRQAKAELEGINIDILGGDTADELSKEDWDDIVNQAFRTADAINQITEAYTRAAEERTRAIEEEIDASENRMRQLESDRDHEWERMKEGYANNYDLKQRELEDERKRNERLQQMKDKAVREEVRRKNIEIAIQTILTTAELMYASAKMIGDGAKKGGIIGALLALSAVGAMVAGFMSIKANTQKQMKYRKGGYRDLDGPSHEEGGVDVTHEAEGGEGMSIFNRQANRKYKNQIRDFTKAANNGTLLNGWNRISGLAATPMPSANIVLSDEYSRKLYELQKEHYDNVDMKVVQIGPNRTMIIRGNEIKYVTHHAN